jgi:hypothetical protein
MKLPVIKKIEITRRRLTVLKTPDIFKTHLSGEDGQYGDCQLSKKTNLPDED